MSLWNKLDNASSAPKYLINSSNTSIVPAANTSRDYGGLSRNLDLNNAFFVDSTEATVASNRAKGIKTPGWMLFKTYGNGRKYVEVLVSMTHSANTVVGDFGITGNTSIEDSTVADG